MTGKSAVTAGVALAVSKFFGVGVHLGLVTPDFLVRWKVKLASMHDRAKDYEE